MSHDLTATPGDPNTHAVTVPDPGDGRTASSVATPMQTLLNGIAWLRGLLTGSVPHAVAIDGSLETTGNFDTQQITATKATIAGDFTTTSGGIGVFSGGLIVGEGGSIANDLGVGGNLEVGGTLIADDNIFSLAGGFIKGRVLCTGEGRLRRAAVVVPTGISADPIVVDPAIATTWMIDAQAHPRSGSVENTAGVDDDELEIAMLPSGTGNGVGFGVGGLTLVLPLKWAAGEIFAIKCKKIAGTWRVVSSSIAPL